VIIFNQSKLRKHFVHAGFSFPATVQYLLTKAFFSI